MQAKGDIHNLSLSEQANKHMEQLFLSQVNREDVKQFAEKKSMPYRELMSYYRCACHLFLPFRYLYAFRNIFEAG